MLPNCAALNYDYDLLLSKAGNVLDQMIVDYPTPVKELFDETHLFSKIYDDIEPIFARNVLKRNLIDDAISTVFSKIGSIKKAIRLSGGNFSRLQTLLKVYALQEIRNLTIAEYKRCKKEKMLAGCLSRIAYEESVLQQVIRQESREQAQHLWQEIIDWFTEN